MALSNGPNLGLLVNGALGEVHYTELMRFLRGVDALVMPKAKDKDLAAPPGSPVDGDVYIVAASPTGAWAGHAGKIARWSTALDPDAWEFYTPKEGWEVWIEDEDKNYAYTGSAWAESTGGGQPLDAMLTAIAALTTVADRMMYFTGADAPALTPLTAYMRTLLDDANAAAARTTLELEKGVALGVVPLEADGKILSSYLPASILGQVEYKGLWDATTAAPTAGPGFYYIVSVAGSTHLSGYTDWKVGDWAIYDSASWSKVDNTDAVSSVAGLVGVITAAALKTALALVKADVGLGNADNTSDANKPISTATQTALDGKVSGSQVSTFGFTLIDDANAAAARTTLELVGRHMVPIIAGAIQPSVTGGCSAVTSIASAANQPDIVTLNFDPTTQEYAQFSIPMPESWNEGTVTFQPIWSHAATTTNFGVVFDLQLVAVSNDDLIAANFGTAQSSTDTGGTTNDLYVGPESAAITIAGTPATGDTLFGRISRVVSNGSDNMAIDARLHGIRLYITTAAVLDT